MPPLKDHKAFFAHIPKTAGSSVFEAFGMSRRSSHWLQRRRNHRTIPELAAEGWMEPYEGWFVFSIVRNPWDRLVSAYHFWNRRKRHWPTFREWVLSVVEPSLERWFPPDRYVLKTPIRSLECLFTSPQYRFVYDENMRLCADFLARFETLRQDWQVICEKIGASVELPHINKSRGRRHYGLYYDDEIRELVQRYYKVDIDTFGYEY